MACEEVNKFLIILNFQNSSPVQDVEVKKFAVTVVIFTAGTFQQISQGSSTDDDHSVVVKNSTWYVYPGVCNLWYFLWRDMSQVLWPEELPTKSYWQGCRYKWRYNCSWQWFPFFGTHNRWTTQLHVSHLHQGVFCEGIMLDENVPSLPTERKLSFYTRMWSWPRASLLVVWMVTSY